MTYCIGVMRRQGTNLCVGLPNECRHGQHRQVLQDDAVRAAGQASHRPVGLRKPGRDPGRAWRADQRCNAATGKKPIGPGVRKELRREGFANALQPITGMNADQFETTGRRMQLTSDAKRECRILDSTISAVSLRVNLGLLNSMVGMTALGRHMPVRVGVARTRQCRSSFARNARRGRGRLAASSSPNCSLIAAAIAVRAVAHIDASGPWTRKSPGHTTGTLAEAHDADSPGSVRAVNSERYFADAHAQRRLIRRSAAARPSRTSQALANTLATH